MKNIYKSKVGIIRINELLILSQCLIGSELS